MRVLRGYRIAGMPEARRVYRQALAAGRPTIVCANHLTLYDSIYLHHGLAPLADYFRDFRRFAWNLPAIENFTNSLCLRTLVYLGKCIPIDRKGDAAHHDWVLAQVRHLVSHGDVCAIFPEGGRSRSGRVDPDDVTYGIGHILRELDRPQVVCAYLRGERQETWADVPAWGDTLHLTVELLEPTTEHKGLRASRDLARQVAVRLRAMEDAHFSRMMAKP
jgi:1-acyl-sn-glycerol-3-phosphate acyltransferase